MEDQSGVTQETGQSFPQMDEEISGKVVEKEMRNNGGRILESLERTQVKVIKLHLV